MSRLGRLFAGFRSRKQAESPREPEVAAAVAWVVAGLGNPGERYSRSRHNAGFIVVERLAASRRAEFARRRFKGITAQSELAGAPAILVKPETYYNASGECIAALLGYFKVPAERLIVVHDELDLEWFAPAVERAAAAVEAIAAEGLERAMSRFNQRL